MQERIYQLELALKYIETQANYAIKNINCSLEVENIFKNIISECWENKNE